MKKIILSLVFLVYCFGSTLQAQLVVANPSQPGHSSAMLHVISPSNNPRGTLLTPMSNTQRQQIANPANGLLIYNTDFQAFDYFKNGVWTVIADTNRVKTMLDLKAASLLSLINIAEQNAKNYTDSKVLYLNKRIDSVKINHNNLLNNFNTLSSNFNILNGNVTTFLNSTLPTLQGQVNNAWNTNGNNVAAGAFLGTTNNEPLALIQNNQQVAKFYDNSTLFIGLESGLNSITTGSNIGIGKLSFKNVSSAVNSIGIGNAALLNCQGCNSDLAIGADAMAYGNSLSFNVAIGRGALHSSHVGKNTAIGNLAGINTNGFGNVFIGSQTKSTIPNISNSFVIGSEAEVGCSDCGILGNANTKVGIGTSTPTEKLEVVGGKTKVETLQITNGSPTQGKVLTATDNQGNATWSTPNTGWGLNGNNDIGVPLILGTISTSGSSPIKIVLGNRPMGQITPNSIMLGFNAGVTPNSANYPYQSVLLGSGNGYNSPFCTGSIGVGENNVNSMTGNSIFNSAIGFNCIQSVSNSSNNIAIGIQCLQLSTNANDNIVLGNIAGTSLNGSRNIILGKNAAINYAGNNSIFIGENTGSNGSNIVQIGTGTLTSPSNSVTIGNTQTATAQIYGQLLTTSDRRLKQNITDNRYGLAYLKDFKTYEYEYITVPGKKRVGIMAQDLLLLERKYGKSPFLDTPSDLEKGNYSVSYLDLVPVSIKAIQEQQTQIESQQKEISDLKKENEDMRKRMEKIEKLLLEMKK